MKNSVMLINVRINQAHYILSYSVKFILRGESEKGPSASLFIYTKTFFAPTPQSPHVSLMHFTMKYSDYVYAFKATNPRFLPLF